MKLTNMAKNSIFYISRQGTEESARNIIMNETLIQMFPCEFCKTFKNALLIEHLPGVCFKKDVTIVCTILVNTV